MRNTQDRALKIISEICGVPGLASNLDLNLFSEGALDSLSFAELIVRISEEFKIAFPFAEIERKDWATPRQIIAVVESRADHADYQAN